MNVAPATPFEVMLRLQVRRQAPVVGLATLAALAVPMLSVQGASTSMRRPEDLLVQVQGWGNAYPLLATAVGALVAMTIWAADVRGRHVHALSLPIDRRQYVLLRFGIGGLLLLPPVLGVLLGGFVTTLLTPLSTGLQSYAGWLGLRFALATLTAYSLVFAASTATRRTALLLFAVIVLAASLPLLLAVVPSADGTELNLLELFRSDRGPFGLFAGRWMLIDV